MFVDRGTRSVLSGASVDQLHSSHRRYRPAGRHMRCWREEPVGAGPPSGSDGDTPPDPVRSAPVNALRTGLVALLWLAIALVIAVGVAGLAATMNRAPGTPARAELTWDGDREAQPALDAATSDLQALSDRVDDLGATARDALSQVAAGDVDGLQQAIAKGTLTLSAID